MNKRAIAPIMILVIIAAVLIIINIIGIATFANRLSDSPLLIIGLIFGFLILLRMLKK